MCLQLVSHKVQEFRPNSSGCQAGPAKDPANPRGRQKSGLLTSMSIFFQAQRWDPCCFPYRPQRTFRSSLTNTLQLERISEVTLPAHFTDEKKAQASKEATILNGRVVTRAQLSHLFMTSGCVQQHNPTDWTRG